MFTRQSDCNARFNHWRNVPLTSVIFLTQVATAHPPDASIPNFKAHVFTLKKKKDKWDFLNLYVDRK